MKELAEKLKSLSSEELSELQNELHASSVIIGECPQGYYYDTTTNSCVLDAGV